MKIVFILLGLVIVSLILKACISTTDQLKDDKSRPPADIKPTKQVDNDKVIVVSNVNADQIKQVLTEFCNIYNKSQYAAIPRITTISSNLFAVTFPYDVDFQTFCFAVNYLKYPTDIQWQSKVYAWVTTKENDYWITDKSKNKKVMLFLANDDKEYDNVFMTTEDNIGYKLGFAVGHEKQLLHEPKEQYVKPTVNLESLTGLPFIDVE